MDKKALVANLLEQLNTELDKAKAAYKTAKSTTQDPDFKSESKWDTRSIEAGYLAGAQKVRVDELEMDVNAIEELATGALDKKPSVGIGSLVEIKHNETTRKYFIAPAAGGYMVNLDGDVALVISVFSPIGNEVLDLTDGDIFEVETAGKTREYEVISYN
ncbi:GreA/GreB family elongation factor [Halobacteriovorax sp.]|uniref:GreA/GreB family elongation factor n=1 Tax=Halobacteriovorax sp. TaxID=2020862 RepID=UPI00356A361A